MIDLEITFIAWLVLFQVLGWASNFQSQRGWLWFLLYCCQIVILQLGSGHILRSMLWKRRTIGVSIGLEQGAVKTGCATCMVAFGKIVNKNGSYFPFLFVDHQIAGVVLLLFYLCPSRRHSSKGPSCWDMLDCLCLYRHVDVLSGSVPKATLM